MSMGMHSRPARNFTVRQCKTRDGRMSSLRINRDDPHCAVRRLVRPRSARVRLGGRDFRPRVSGSIAPGCRRPKRRGAPRYGDETHPPYKLRSERVVDTFYEFFDAVYEGPRLRDLKFILEREQRPVVSERTREQIGHAFDFANGLFTLWKPVKELLHKDYVAKRPLHPMWLSGAQRT